jgi:hypothetical protein
MCAPCTSFYAHCILLTVRGTDIALRLTHRPQTLVLRVKRKKLTVFVQAEPTDTVLEVKHKLHDMLSQVRDRASRCCLVGGATMRTPQIVTRRGTLQNGLLTASINHAMSACACHTYGKSTLSLAGLEPFSIKVSHGVGTMAVQCPKLHSSSTR